MCGQKTPIRHFWTSNVQMSEYIQCFGLFWTSNVQKLSKYYTVESRLRPFWRRRLITFFPFFDALRTRKPWVPARFFFFGWYVCDIISHYTLCSQKNPAFWKILIISNQEGILPSLHSLQLIGYNDSPHVIHSLETLSSPCVGFV